MDRRPSDQTGALWTLLALALALVFLLPLTAGLSELMVSKGCVADTVSTPSH